MKSAPASPWAKTPTTQRREPTAGELANGYPCGPFDMQLFNELAYRLFQATREIHTVVTSAGLSPNDDDLTQLWQAIRKKFSIYWGVDTGTKNAIVCNLDPAPDAYTVPMLMVVRKIGTANDGAMTANFNGLGAVALKDMTGADLSSGALPANGYQIIMFDGTQFRVLGGSSSYTTISGLTATGGEVIDVTVGGVINANYEKPGYEAAFADTDVLTKKKAGGVHKKFTWADLIAAMPNGEDPLWYDAANKLYKVRRATTTQIGVVRKATPSEVAARVAVADKPYVGPEDLPAVDPWGIGVGAIVIVPFTNVSGAIVGLNNVVGKSISSAALVAGTNVFDGGVTDTYTGACVPSGSAFSAVGPGSGVSFYNSWSDVRRATFTGTWTVVNQTIGALDVTNGSGLHGQLVLKRTA